MINSLNTTNVDPIRRFWIDDNLPSWTAIEGDLSYEVLRQVAIQQFSKTSASHEKSCVKAIYLGDFLNIWGHCITDNLKKIWFLKTPEGQKYLSEGYKLVCTLVKGSELSQNFIKLLSYLEIDGNSIQIVPYGSSFEELIIPQDSLGENHKYYKEFKDTVDIIRDKIPLCEGTPEKIYFSRARLHNGRDFGEKYIEQVFRKLGFEIKYPETLALEKQFELLKNCKEFAATEGSVSHVLMFCQDNINVTIIRKTVSLNGYQFSVNAMRNVDVTYVDAHASLFQIFDNSFGPFFLYVNDNMVSFAKDKGLEIKKVFPMAIFLRYLVQVIFYIIRFRTKPKKIRDISFYYDRLKKDWKFC